MWNNVIGTENNFTFSGHDLVVQWEALKENLEEQQIKLGASEVSPQLATSNSYTVIFNNTQIENEILFGGDGALDQLLLGGKTYSPTNFSFN